MAADPIDGCETAIGRFRGLIEQEAGQRDEIGLRHCRLRPGKTGIRVVCDMGHGGIIRIAVSVERCGGCGYGVLHDELLPADGLVRRRR